MKVAQRVLIIDDNPKNIQVAASVLEQAGITCEFALDGASGLSWLESEHFDLVLLDVMMPGEDGFEICRLIKSNKALQSIPVIFLTAKTDRESMVRGFESGGADYITKPFDAKELEIRVKNNIELKVNRGLLEDMNQRLAKLVEEKTLDLNQANRELEKTVTQLKEKHRELQLLELSKQQFINMLGSEVSGSINEITGMLQVIKYRVDSRKIAGLIDRVDNALSKIEVFVNAGLRVIDLQSKGSALMPERVDLNKIVGYALIHLDEKIRRKQISIMNHASNLPYFVAGESQLLMAAFIITLDFFMERNLPNTILGIEIVHETKGVTVVFTDQGQQVSAGDIVNILNEGFPGSHSLSFVKLIAEAHLGGIEVNNRRDAKGIEVRLLLYAQS